jgi:pimeloyl-ACP methyl ester carboxylesterase
MSLLRVPVRGGELAVEVGQGSTEPVLAVHGISSQRRLWDWLRIEAPELALVAPDLRGRADSIGVEGPSSVAQHVEDLVAVLDAAGLDRVHVLGMSMGGFIAVELAVRHPERVKSLVLVDGGPRMTPAPGLTRELLPTAFADRLARLEHSWGSVEELAAFFTSSTGPLLDPADPVLIGYLAHDLDADGRVRLSGAALLDDAADVFFGDNHWSQLSVPVRLLAAEWSVGEGSAPAYPVDVLEQLDPAPVRTLVLPGVDHATSIMSKAGAVATAELLSEALA